MKYLLDTLNTLIASVIVVDVDSKMYKRIDYSKPTYLSWPTDSSIYEH